MKNILASLSNIKDPSLLRRLLETYNLFQNLYSLEKDMLFTLVSFYDERGLTPPQEWLLDNNFPFDSSISSMEDIDVYLKEKVLSLREKQLRQSLMALATKPVISVDDVYQAAALIVRDRDFKLDSSSSVDGRAMYKQTKDRPAGMKFFIRPLDDEIYGLAYGTLTTLFAFVSSLKSTLAVSLAYKNALELGYNVAFVTLEVPKRELYFNFLSRHAFTLDSSTKVTATRIKKGLLTRDEEEFVFGVVEPSFKEMPGRVFILDIADISASTSGQVDGSSFLGALQAADSQCNGLDAFIVDYVNLMKFFKSAGSVDQGVNQFIAYLHELTITFSQRGLIGIQLAQANREGWKRACKRGGAYSIDALAEFFFLERASYNIVSLFYDQALRAAGEVKVQLLKNRSGNLIEEPFVTTAQPEWFFVGDIVGQEVVYSEAALDELLD